MGKHFRNFADFARAVRGAMLPPYVMDPRLLETRYGKGVGDGGGFLVPRRMGMTMVGTVSILRDGSMHRHRFSKVRKQKPTFREGSVSHTVVGQRR